MAAPPQELPLLNTYQSLLQTFTDFLTVAIHTILYERSIYPASTFISTRKYNFPVRQNRHPKVCKWITDAVAAVETEMLRGAVERVAVVVYDLGNRPLERFMFDVGSFPVVPKAEALTLFEDEEEHQDGESYVGEESMMRIRSVDVEEQLRAAVRKLAYCGSKLSPLPQGCTYTVIVELKDQVDPPIGHPQPWQPSAPSLQTRERGKSNQTGSDIGGVKSMPIRSVEAGEFIMEMWIEEGKAKQAVPNQ